MNLSGNAFLVLTLLLFCKIIVFVRLTRGPTIGDRIIALDLINTILISLLAVYSVMTGNVLYLDVAIVAAVIAFLGTVLFAKHIDRVGSGENIHD